MKKKDLLWLLAYPVYQIIGTLRHEGSHALAAMAEGIEIGELVFWPNTNLGSFGWGYVFYYGHPTWFATAAPYFCDLITVFIALLITLVAKPRPRWLWLNILIIGVLSPFINSVANYGNGVLRGRGDVGELLGTLDPVAVHLYFALTFAFCAWAIYHCCFRKKTWRPG